MLGVATPSPRRTVGPSAFISCNASARLGTARPSKEPCRRGRPFSQGADFGTVFGLQVFCFFMVCAGKDGGGFYKPPGGARIGLGIRGFPSWRVWTRHRTNH